MKVLITGASGRFGKYLIRELRGGHDMVLFSRSAPPEECADLPWIQGDLGQFEDCRRAVEGCDAIMHVGAVPGPTDHPEQRRTRRARGDELPPFDATMHTNIMGTYYLLMAAVQAGVKVVVQTGSNCVYGHGFRISNTPFSIQYLPLDEEHPCEPEDSYSFSKLVDEQLLASYTRAYGLRTYAIRSGGICPPERRRAMAENATPVTAWSPWMWGYVASEDLAILHRLLLEKADSLPMHDVYIANALDTSILEPSREVIARFRPDLLPVLRDMEGHRAFFSTAKAKEAVGWVPTTSWRECLPA